MINADHERFMRRAIALAAPRVGLTADNPAVGCVIVRDGVIVGEAATAEGGRPHAEEQALASAGEAADGADVYVTLEPCGERTSGEPSCALRLLRAGVREVFVACADGSPFASGRGCAVLLGGGVAVTRGVLEAEATGLYAAYGKGAKNLSERPD
jgi:diaminohydroxyphosphoribosylaminopyrimidine deaminase/5-amino-6-(5-phosphoribosylamino)uracil reductase